MENSLTQTEKEGLVNIMSEDLWLSETRGTLWRVALERIVDLEHDDISELKLLATQALEAAKWVGATEEERRAGRCRVRGTDV